MRRPPVLLAVLGAALLGALPRLTASTTAVHDLSALCAQAELISEVEVLDRECVDLGDGQIETRYTLATVLPMKGAMSSVHQVRIPGGAVGLRGSMVPGMPSLQTGERAILFLSEEGTHGWRVPVGLDRGAFTVRTAAEGTTEVVSKVSHCAGTHCTHGGPVPAVQSYDAFVQAILREVG